MFWRFSARERRPPLPVFRVVESEDGSARRGSRAGVSGCFVHVGTMGGCGMLPQGRSQAHRQGRRLGAPGTPFVLCSLQICLHLSHCWVNWEAMFYSVCIMYLRMHALCSVWRLLFRCRSLLWCDLGCTSVLPNQTKSVAPGIYPARLYSKSSHILHTVQNPRHATATKKKLNGRFYSALFQ